MNWAIFKGGAVFSQLTAAAQGKWDIFQNDIHHNGRHPKIAAMLLGASNYKELDSRISQFQLRLSGAERATFLVDSSRLAVTVIRVGGHT